MLSSLGRAFKELFVGWDFVKRKPQQSAFSAKVRDGRGYLSAIWGGAAGGDDSQSSFFDLVVVTRVGLVTVRTHRRESFG